MTSIYTAVAKNILEFIEENGLQFGVKLPSERSLADRFGVSRSSVREGIRFLANKGILLPSRRWYLYCYAGTDPPGRGSKQGFEKQRRIQRHLSASLHS